MTQTEAIAAAKRGERVKGKHSIHECEKPGSAQCCHKWRTLFCNNVDDVDECYHCGRQVVCACRFDEDYA